MRKLFVAALLLTATLQAQAIRSNPGFRTNSVPRNDDGSSALIPVGFSVNFFGRTRSHAYVNNNGNITFDQSLATFTPFGLTNTRREIIAAYFADVDTRDLGSQLVTFGQDTIDGKRAFGVNYLNVGYYNIHSDKLNSFQIVLIDRTETGDGNFDIEFNYSRINWETGDASGGLNGFGGTPAVVGWSNGSGEPGTSFELEGSLQTGAFLDGARRGLSRNRLNSTVAGRYLFRARNGQILPPLSIVTGCPLPPASVGAPYLQRFSAVGALSYQWSLLADPGAMLPAGLNLTQDGTYTGNPSANGTTEFTIQLNARTEDGEQIVTKRCSLTVRPPTVTITSACPLPAGAVGQNYSRSLQATGGRAPYTWSLADGSSSLPLGLSLSSSGTLSGVPREAGTTVLTLQASSNPNDGGQPTTKNCSLTVNASVLQLTSGCSLAPATSGVPYNETLTVAGGVAPYTWSLNSPLPSGLSLSRDGVVSGAALGNGGVFLVRVQDARGTVSEQSCSLTVNAPLINVTTACPLPTGTIGQAYAQRIGATGGVPPYNWAVIGSLPSGMSLSSEGVLSGNPGSAGPVSFRFLVTDAAGNSAAAGCNLVVQRSNFSMTTCPLPNASVGVDYIQSLNVDGGAGPYVFSVVSGLPAGMSLNTSGLLTGRPRESGKATVTIRVMDSAGRTSTQACGMQVEPSALTVVGTCPLPEARIGTPYLQRFTATGGVAPYRFRLQGRLPQGLELASDGTLRGTPLSAAETEFEVEVTDALNHVVPKRCSVQSSLPDSPTFRISAIPGTLPAASNGPTLQMEMSRAYLFPIQGEFVLTSEADTGSFEEPINQSDPRVRFTNGERRIRFTVPAGATQASTPIVSTGTVAGLMTLRAINLTTAGNPIPTAPAPKQFRVARGVPVLTDACLATTTAGPELRMTGYTTTRQLNRAEFSFTAGTQQKTENFDMSASAADYFLSDASIRNGGAFTISVPFLVQGTGTLQPSNVTLSNSVGTSAARTVAACR